jgi:ankyrin repeat protein
MRLCRGDALPRLLVALALLLCSGAAVGQAPPSTRERAAYTGLHAAAARGDLAEIVALTSAGAAVHAGDAYGRTPLHVAAYARQREAMRALAKAGADPNALERDRYDVVTIAAVADDVPTLRTALEIGGSARNVTSRYDGTALIAATHLGHAEVVRIRIAAGAPVDHVNNLGWTALIESIVLGDGGPRHLATLQALIAAGADVNLPDAQGTTPLAVANAPPPGNGAGAGTGGGQRRRCGLARVAACRAQLKLRRWLKLTAFAPLLLASR